MDSSHLLQSVSKFQFSPFSIFFSLSFIVSSLVSGRLHLRELSVLLGGSACSFAWLVARSILPQAAVESDQAKHSVVEFAGGLMKRSGVRVSRCFPMAWSISILSTVTLEEVRMKDEFTSAKSERTTLPMAPPPGLTRPASSIKVSKM